VKQEFETRARCVKVLYNAFNINGEHVKGEKKNLVFLIIMLYHALNIKGEHVKGENIFLLFFLMISYLAFNINGEHVKRAKNNISLIFLIIIL
jgi:hypothetical protein